MEIRITALKKICTNLLIDKGFSKDDAQTIVDIFLYGELSGKKSHGFASFLDFKGPSTAKRWKIVKEDDSYALIDAKENSGQIVGKAAMLLAIKKARKKGIALVGMNNMYTYTIPGYYARLAALHGMIGIVMNNSSPKVAPYGGIEPKLGTNPLAIALPTEKQAFVLDMATSTRAMGEVRLAKKLGTTLPEGMALDKEGNPTQNTEDVNALMPFGGYKGFGLGLAIEALAGAFVRAKMTKQVKTSLDRGYLFMVINPNIFVSLPRFKKEVSAMLKDVISSKKAKGHEEIRYPGELSEALFQKNMKRGYVEIDDKILEEIKKCCG